MFQFLKIIIFLILPAFQILTGEAAPPPFPPEAKQQPVTGTTLLQHSGCRHTALETISCRAAEIH